ncbi:MAG: hypothetical protein D3910_24420 [Candidatus Electrothrix sp. ATG2]|nr:hypothetical protein [Candidatus Electrothrix sp. ATG2]
MQEADRKKIAGLMKQLRYTALHEAEADYINTQMCYSRQTGHGISCSYDIHWQMSNCNRQFSREFADGKLFKHAEAIPSLGENARALSTVDALIYACFHRAGHFAHSGDRLIWLYDIHLLCQALNEQETTAFCQRAKKLKIIALCVDAITMTRFWFGTVLSQEFEVFVQEEAEEDTSALLLGTDRNDGIRKHTLLELKGFSTWRERLSFLTQNAFPPAEFMLWRYNQKNTLLLPWLYLRRFAEGVFIFLRK